MRFLVFCWGLLLSIQIYATHIKAGEIVSERDASNPYRQIFTITIYYDKVAVNRVPALLDILPILSFGDNGVGTAQLQSPGILDIGNDVLVGIYKTSYTYAGPGTFKVGYKEVNRIAGILNMSNSVATPLYLENQITISPFLGINSTPILTVPPIDLAGVGQIYTHNPGAYDPDGDSISFELVEPLKDRGLSVDGYVSPADAQFGGSNTAGGPASFIINPITGQITWDTPGKIGFYNIAIRVNEYRNGVFLGYTVRDMQIEVKQINNLSPDVKFAKDTCVVAGQNLRIEVKGSDPNINQSIIMLAYGGVFEINPAATFLPATNPVSNPSTKIFSWTPTCQQVQNQAHQAIFKVQDNVVSEQRLAVVKNWQIKVIGAAPILDSVVEQPNNAAKLFWKAYKKTASCSRSDFQILVYRSTCDSILNYDPCDNKLPDENGTYKLIASLPATDTTFLDDNEGKGLQRGLTYYYTILINFTATKFGKSKASTIKRLVLSLDVPVIGTVSVLNNNSIKIQWNKPKSTASGPFGYKIWRSTNSGTFVPITKYYSINTLIDSSFIDNDVIANQNKYTYKVSYFVKGDSTTERLSDAKSAQWLKAESANKAVILTWDNFGSSEVIQTKIYASNKLIDSVSNTNTYIARNLTNCENYCFSVEVKTAECIAGKKVKSSFSNEACAIPKDTSNKLLQVKALQNLCGKISCGQLLNPPYIDTLYWPSASGLNCDNKVSYKLYYRESASQNFDLLSATTDTFFIHSKSTSFSGCYYISTVINNVEKPAGNIYCINNTCACYELPNVITPNGDGKNDVFKPLPYPRFVKKVEINIYNRYGKLVFNSNDNILINWEPSADIADGIYYYEADVYFITAENENMKHLKGWVHVIR